MSYLIRGYTSEDFPSLVKEISKDEENILPDVIRKLKADLAQGEGLCSQFLWSLDLSLHAGAKAMRDALALKAARARILLSKLQCYFLPTE